MSEVDQQRGEREMEGVFSLINSTAGFLGFTDSWDLIDDGLFACGDGQGFLCSRLPVFLCVLTKILYFISDTQRTC